MIQNLPLFHLNGITGIKLADFFPPMTKEPLILRLRVLLCKKLIPAKLLQRRRFPWAENGPTNREILDKPRIVKTWIVEV
jgi:hypothetical protein